LKIKTIISIVIAVVVVGTIIAIFSPNVSKSGESILDFTIEKEPEIIEWYEPNSLFRLTVYEDDLIMQGGKVIPLEANFGLKPELEDIYEVIRVDNEVQKTVVVIPIFTASAYWEPGFYTYFRGVCDSSCLTTKIPSMRIRKAQSGSLHSTGSGSRKLPLYLASP